MSEWVSKNGYLTAAETLNNAKICYSFFVAQGWSANAIAAMLGSMEGESGINPGLWEQGMPQYGPMTGYGLTQWTPYSVLVNVRPNDWESGNGQLAAYPIEIAHERDRGWGGNEWILTTGYEIWWSEWIHSSLNTDYLVQAFINNYLRPATTDHPNYQANARKWLEYILADEFPDTPLPPDPEPGPQPPEPTPGGGIDMRNPVNLVTLLKGWKGCRYELLERRR